MATKLKRYMFWYYDLPPFMLGAQIDKVRPRSGGYYEPKGYGGLAFKPLKILRGKKGEQAVVKLKQLIADGRERERTLRNELRYRALELIK